MPLNEFRDYSIIDMKLAYAAGLFDGEGCITPRGAKQYYLLRITLVNTFEAPVDFMVNLFGGYTSVSERVGCRPLHQWGITGMKAAEVLEKLLPYLIMKKERAILGIELGCLPFDSMRRREIASRIKELNHEVGGGEHST